MELKAQMVIRELMIALLAVEKMEHQDLRNYRIIYLPNRHKQTLLNLASCLNCLWSRVGDILSDFLRAGAKYA